MKSAKRRRVDVNLDELDRVLDGARQAPLSDADCDKLKSALHALAAMLAPSRNTEKTSTVIEEPENLETSDGTQPDTSVSPQPGHGRNGAEAFGGARTVNIAHQKLTHGTAAQSVGKATYTVRRSRRCWCGSWARRRWRLQCTRWSGCGAARAGRCLRRKSRKA
jgi:hypothetical protein